MEFYHVDINTETGFIGFDGKSYIEGNLLLYSCEITADEVSFVTSNVGGFDKLEEISPRLWILSGYVGVTAHYNATNMTQIKIKSKEIGWAWGTTSPMPATHVNFDVVKNGILVADSVTSYTWPSSQLFWIIGIGAVIAVMVLSKRKS